MKDDEHEKALEISEKIQRCITDITEAVQMNLDDESILSIMTAFSALVSVTSYYEFKLRHEGVEISAIEKTKNAAENYVLTLISEELNLAPQGKGDA